MKKLIIPLLIALCMCGLFSCKDEHSAEEKALVKLMCDYNEACANASDTNGCKISFVLDETGETVITSADVIKAQSYHDENNGGYVVSVSLTAAGSEKFFTATANNIGKTMSIIVTQDGTPNTISSPTINSAVSGDAVIYGDFTADAAAQLADEINAGLDKSELIAALAGEYNTLHAALGSREYLPNSLAYDPPYTDVTGFINKAKAAGFDI